MMAVDCQATSATRILNDQDEPVDYPKIERIADTNTIISMVAASEMLSNRVVRSERFRRLTLTPA